MHPVLNVQDFEGVNYGHNLFIIKALYGINRVCLQHVVRFMTSIAVLLTINIMNPFRVWANDNSSLISDINVQCNKVIITLATNAVFVDADSVHRTKKPSSPTFIFLKLTPLDDIIELFGTVTSLKFSYKVPPLQLSEYN